MPHSFKNAQLQAIFERRQTEHRGGPLESAWRRTSWRWIFSCHNIDLAFVAALYVLVLVAAVVGLVASGLMGTPTGLGPGLQILFGTAIFGTFMELLRRIYDTAIKRLATIDLFTSEMLSIMRVFAAGNIIGEFVRLYDQLDGHMLSSLGGNSGNASGTELLTPSGFADSARKENYFSIFDKNSTDLASLNPAVVNDITAFYTFLKGSRDATGAMQLWKEKHYPTASKMEDITAIVYLCFLMTLHGKLALDQLVSSPENRAAVDDIFAGVQLQCFGFLDLTLSAEDFRRARIDQRRASFKALSDDHGYKF